MVLLTLVELLLVYAMTRSKMTSRSTTKILKRHTLIDNCQSVSGRTTVLLFLFLFFTLYNLQLAIKSLMFLHLVLKNIDISFLVTW